MTGKMCLWRCFGVWHGLDPQFYGLLSCIALPRLEMKKDCLGPKSVHLPAMENHQSTKTCSHLWSQTNSNKIISSNKNQQ